MCSVWTIDLNLTVENSKSAVVSMNSDIKHPHYPRSNGKADGGILIIKNVFKKSELSAAYSLLELLTYRAAPLEETGMSPARLVEIMGKSSI